MTGPGTNTYLIGRESLFVLDPGESDDLHMEVLISEIGRTPVVGIAPSHCHPDHWPLCGPLAARLDAPALGHVAKNGYAPHRQLKDGERIRGKDWTLEVLHTPGHVSDHVAFYFVEERVLFSGDHVMAWSTSVISRPDGSLASYMQSLERLRGMEIAVMYPAHGEAVVDPEARVEELIEHRRERTRQILEALAEGANSVPGIVARVYSDVDPRLHGMARHSVLAHLEALMESGEVTAEARSPDPADSFYTLR